MNHEALKVENISKQYHLGLTGTRTVSHDFSRIVAKVRGKEDPYLKLGSTNTRAIKTNSEYVWALKDINFKVSKGEVVGLVGKNGAGKSTLLKLISRITSPSQGSISYNGKLSSLLEVGTGFHPELTGRENIFLNGAILGMKRLEIQQRLDEIVDFAGIENYIDTPVKRYSSGMTVRLGFAVSAHLEPDILVVDEVLAVGDYDFQRKCMNKMSSVSKETGRTIIFVSHNLSSIKKLCNRSILLEDGRLVGDGPTDGIIDQYIGNSQDLVNIPLSERNDREGYGDARITNINIKSINSSQASVGEDIIFTLTVQNKSSSIVKIRPNISITTIHEEKLISCDSKLTGEYLELKANQESLMKCIIKSPNLNCGEYLVNVSIRNILKGYELEDRVQSAAILKIHEKLFENHISYNNFPILNTFHWSLGAYR